MRSYQRKSKPVVGTGEAVVLLIIALVIVGLFIRNVLWFGSAEAVWRVGEGMFWMLLVLPLLCVGGLALCAVVFGIRFGLYLLILHWTIAIVDAFVGKEKD